MFTSLLLVGGPMFAILFQGWKAWDFTCWWRPTQAVTVDSDYSDSERLADRAPFAWLVPHPFADGRTGRRTKVDIDYLDADGRHHRTQVVDFVRRGLTARPAMRIYVDSRNPDRVDRYGVTGAVGMMLFWGMLLAYILFRMGTDVPHG